MQINPFNLKYTADATAAYLEGINTVFRLKV